MSSAQQQKSKEIKRKRNREKEGKKAKEGSICVSERVGEKF